MPDNLINYPTVVKGVMAKKIKRDPVAENYYQFFRMFQNFVASDKPPWIILGRLCRTLPATPECDNLPLILV
jgi:hypothetical protein